jgi:CheY-like chemotaxis protein
MIDVATSTLRSWEERYGLVVPARSDAGQRLYSRDQVEQLRYVAQMVDTDGLQASEAHRLLEQRLDAIETIRPPDAGDAPRQVFILLAERDPFAAELSEYLLRTEGYGVLVATDSEGASSTYARQQPDLVIVELMISGGRGTQLCRELAENGVSILATSALDLGDEALEAGADAFLLKPFDPLHLVSAVRDLLGTSALTRPQMHTTSR